MSNKARYEDILRRIQQKQAEEASQPKQDDLATVLDGLDALGFLEKIKRRPPEGRVGFGPKVFRGHTAISHSDEKQYWCGVLVWHKPKGYGHYQTLEVLGIWAVEVGEAVEIIVGTKTLAFSAPIFNAESYQIQMKRSFKTYYDGDASPPHQPSPPNPLSLRARGDQIDTVEGGKIPENQAGSPHRNSSIS